MEDIHEFENIYHNSPIKDEVETTIHEEEPIISLHFLSRNSSTQTLKL